MYIILIILGIPVLILICKRIGTRSRRLETVSLMIVVGSGGHTSEILRLVSALPTVKYNRRVYVVAKTDSSSEEKIHQLEENIQKNSPEQGSYDVVSIGRSREVGQSWSSTVISTWLATLSCLPIIWRCKPHVLLCNGPGTCIPPCLVVLLFKVFGLVKTKIVYVESICRVYDLSLSGKILYRLSDHLLVQWPQLHKKYPKSVYLGRFY